VETLPYPDGYTVTIQFRGKGIIMIAESTIMLNDISNDEDFLTRFNYLGVNDMRRLPSNPLTIQVIAGVVWITVGRDDYILSSEEELTIAPGDSPAVISQIGTRPTLYVTRPTNL
jgi:hypothetical protein